MSRLTYRYEGKITVLNIDTKDFVDSTGFS